VIFKQNII